MNVLGIQFDSKLTWAEQVNKSINKTRKTLHAINLIKKYFNSAEFKCLLTSNYYSVLYLFFIRKLFQSIRLYIKGILDGRPAALCLVNSRNVSVLMNSICFQQFIITKYIHTIKEYPFVNVSQLNHAWQNYPTC